MMEYHFTPLSKTCAETGQPLVPGELCYSVLFERNGAFERRDYSRQGWTGVPEGAVGFWRCLVPHPEQKPAVTDIESLFGYFEQLLESPNPQQEKIAYVLALTLLQRRRLKLDGARVADDAEFLQLSGSRGEGPYEVRDLQLSQQELADARQALDQSLIAERGEAA